MTNWENYNSVLTAVTQNGWALKYADESLKDDEHFLSMLMNEGIEFSFILSHSSERIKQKYDEYTLRNLTLHIKGACR